MQTFLPYADFKESARCLDRQRLGKQRIECKQILATLVGDSTGWKNHPAVRMWRNYEVALIKYGLWVCSEWVSRGYKDQQHDYFCRMLVRLSFDPNSSEFVYPPWFGDERFHSAHRAALLAKDFDHYSQFDWTEEPKIDYFWPTKETDYA